MPLQIMKVKERSMEPQIRNGSYIIVNRLAKGYTVGDVVVARHPTKDMMIVKRVERVEGDMVFLVGDNADESDDSRHFGYVSMSGISGKVILSV